MMGCPVNAGNEEEVPFVLTELLLSFVETLWQQDGRNVRPRLPARLIAPTRLITPESRWFSYGTLVKRFVKTSTPLRRVSIATGVADRKHNVRVQLDGDDHRTFDVRCNVDEVQPPSLSVCQCQW